MRCKAWTFALVAGMVTNVSCVRRQPVAVEQPQRTGSGLGARPLENRHAPIAFLRAGRLWTIEEPGVGAISHGPATGMRGLAAAEGGIVCYREDGRLCRIGPPDWRVVPTGPRANYEGHPTWVSGTPYVLAGSGSMDPPEGAIWRIDTATGRSTPIIRDAFGTAYFRVSPSQDLAAAVIGSSGYAAVSILDLKRWVEVPGEDGASPARRWMIGISAAAWLDEGSLLLANEAPVVTSDVGSATDTERWPMDTWGIVRLDVRTRKVAGWLFPDGRAVYDMRGAPQGGRFAATTADPDDVNPDRTSVVLIDTAGKTVRVVRRFSSPAAISGFSADGTQLLVLVSREDEGAEELSDAYVVHTADGTSDLVAGGVTEAVWLSKQ